MLAVDTTELARIFRSEVDDPLQDTCIDDDCLWKNIDVYGYMTEAVDAVMRGVGGVGGQVSVPYLADQSTVVLPKKVYQATSAWLADGKRLRIISQAEAGFDRNFEGQPLDFSKRDVPDTLMAELGYTQVVLYPTPADAGTVTVLGRFTLGMPLMEGMPLPLREIADQRLVLTYMKAQAYSKHDAETYDLGRATSYKNQFDMALLDREVELRRNRRRPGTVRMDW